MCLYPKLIKNRKYVANKKNKGIIPTAADERVLMVPVGCGRCIECMKQKSRQWQVRLQEEIRHDKTGKFVTLTFSNDCYAALAEEIKAEGYELDNEVATKAVRLFLERWRKKYKRSVKHWLITEIGGNGQEKMHIHGIIWTNESNEQISELWKYGGITIGKRLYINGKEMNKYETGYVNESTINYIAKYITKKDKKHLEFQPKILTSAGIGKGYLERQDSKKNFYKPGETKETYTTRQGINLNLPIYYRNAIYTEEQREKLWLEKLDKGERWVCGVKININQEKGYEQYFKVLEEARIKNKRLGYGDDEKNWNKKFYENQARNLKIKNNLKKNKK